MVLAKPLPQVMWYRNDVMVSNTSIVMASSKTASQVRSEIEIQGLSRKDVHTELTCRATNNNKTAPLEATVHVDMNCKYKHKNIPYPVFFGKFNVCIFIYFKVTTTFFNTISNTESSKNYNYNISAPSNFIPRKKLLTFSKMSKALILIVVKFIYILFSHQQF